MLEGFLVPYSLFIENEYLFSFHITEDHVLIKHISCPHQFVCNSFGWDFFKIFNINEMSFNKATEHSFVENDLFSMWNKFCVPSEISLLHPSSWDEHHGNEGWQQHVVGSWNKEVSSKKSWWQ